MKFRFSLYFILFVTSMHFCAAFQTPQVQQFKNPDTTKRSIEKIAIPCAEIKISSGAVPSIKRDTLLLKPSATTNGTGQASKMPDSRSSATGSKSKLAGSSVLSSASIEAGRTKTFLDVSATGGATYTIPLSLPPGLGNALPQVSLSYNSQGSNGNLGIGWNISGISVISRIPATIFHDGFVGSINYNADDRFAMDGQRLLLKSGIYGADGTEYQTENYSNIRIFSRGGTTTGPDYFEVLFPDGSKAYYGIGSAKTASSYSISYSENPIGARINYTYSNLFNSLLITQISYGALGSSAGINQINFNYGAGLRPEQAYAGGEAFYNTGLLNDISIIANGTAYRNYLLTYEVVADVNYQRISSVQELNGDQTKAFEPIYFTYATAGNVIPSSTISNFGISGIDASNSEIITADFTGNGTMDFLFYKKFDKSKFYAFFDVTANTSSQQFGVMVNTGLFEQIIPATWLSHNDKLMPQQGMIVVKRNGPNGYKFEMLSNGISSPLLFQYEKVWDAPFAPDYPSTCDYRNHTNNPLENEFVSGDFNGDGLTDLIAINYGWVISDEYLLEEANTCIQNYTNIGSSAYFINMDRRLTSNYITNVGTLALSLEYGIQKLYTADVNGDGKTDILQVANGVMYVYSLNSQSNTLELLWQRNDSRITLNYPLLLGDYNGDGKMDVMFSTGNNSLFATFMSTGKAFIKEEQYHSFSNTAAYWSSPSGAGSEVLRQYYLIPCDVDGDGKTDIIRAETVTQNGTNGGTINLNIHYNLGISSFVFAPSFTSAYTQSQFTNLRHNPIPIFLNPNRQSFRPEFGFISDYTISLFRFYKDFRKEAQIGTVSQDGVSHSITYNELTGEQSTPDVPLYEISYNQTYPFVDLHTLPGVSVVSKITRNYNGEQLNQVFGYGKAVTHIGGLGFMGFSETIRTNWHVNSNDNNRIFNISLFDPLLRGAPVRSFSTKSTYINPAIKDLALTSPAPAGGVPDGASLSDYISRSDQVYSTQLLPNKVFVNVAVGTASKDMLTETFGTQTMEYDSYFNVTKSTSNFNGTGSKLTEMTYDSNPSGNYIGRPLSTKATLSNGPEIFTTEDQYTYSGFLATQVKKKGNNTDWVIEDMTYDSFGNVTQKTTTAPGGAQRTIAMQYDASGRFMVNNTDIDGMVTTTSYDNSTGNTLTTTNPYGQTTTNTFDTWSRMISTTNYLGKKKTIYYSPSFLGAISVEEVNDDGSSSAIHYNVFGQKRGSRQSTLLGNDVADAVEFDVYGRVYRQSEPAPPGSASQWNYLAYDEYGRPKQSTSFTGKVTNISYNGLSMTVSDGTKTITTTKNAMGQVVSLQDPGGTINYSYFANGNMKTAYYAGITQTVEQDGWGRKTKLTDPSAGVYEYQYDSWGQLTKEITPKGITENAWDATGRITQKKIVGDDTNMQQDYTYDGTTKLLTNMALTNADGNNATYTYNYDGDKRITSTIEDNLHARFVKGFTYDSFGRISTESYEAKNKSNNIIASKTIEMQYQNGELLQATLQGTGQIIWKVNALDGKGNLTETIQGTALKNTMQYDTYGLLQQNMLENISGTPTTLMTQGYSFDGLRGLLNSRSNSAFNWSESFSYDSQDRLTSFHDNLGNNSQEYDNRSRITDNSQLGSYSYDGNSYRQSELNLNGTADAYYQLDRPLQQISYNAFKSPVEIFEQSKERIGFQYNASLGRAHMYYGDELTDKMLRRYRRHYSEEGSMEITNDIQTGKTSFVFYLGGDPYNAPAIWKEVHISGQSTQDLYYLHRDHLGSIVMITNDQGQVVEKRQFDAWGNIVKLQDGLGNDLAAFVILDRGFTGHEHLLSVGLIHMNGRLYDPKLHRFLSPDNFVQDPYNTQTYNRYSYAMNNPLMFTDPNGEFIWAFFAVGALIGALTGGVSYVASAIRTGDWSWSGLGMSMLTGAVIGGVTGGVNPAGLISNSLGTTFATAFVGGFMPSANFSIGDFNFSISPSIVFGKSFGMGANLSVGYSTGKWSFAAGFGFMAYGNYQGFGKGGAEIRASLMAGYDNGTNGFTIGTNKWWGSGEMREFNQRTGTIGLHFGEFRAFYENDGSIGPFGDDEDRYRTASLSLSVGNVSAAFSLFTGNRDYIRENGSVTQHRDPMCIDDFGRRMPNGLVRELNTKYRMGMLTIGYKNIRVGVNSEHVRHAIQDQAIHNLRIPWFNGKSLIDKRQMGFENQSWKWEGFMQYKTLNQFSSW
ncbi:VCBS repeat-containing protein [Pedobacter sp. ISL-68]|uniref:polymorphic toxin type 23 domain-containing protein n=1 Tax=unclassified Pedobacter TaxID=2628915 RepID=UPI001BECA64E|nr:MULTISPECIES: polymorphic toxin type 23 domain-containing protein [unclassified Pedobacter]MBT2559801.1 VCBS repeat-containing protein [Pedobacter sp. ISL-64]MBT2592106.1 VCBS repeat-containing protein [Pedobacter sp. ISL-68]